jgi:dual specificity tyrosine-phosphorylation-regulated kinase 2/3/4
MSSMKGKDSPSNKSSNFPLSPRSVQAFGQPLRKSGSREHALSPPVAPGASWSPGQPDAMTSAASLASLSSVGSTRAPKSPGILTAKIPSRPGTGSSASLHTTSVLSASNNTPLSPSSSMRRHQSKRLTPSSIPFFRRSSSQSMQIPPSNPAALSTSPTLLSSGTGAAASHRVKANLSPNKESSRGIPATPSSSQKKSSVLSLGLPSLLKSSSRRSLHGDKSDSGTKESTKSEKEKSKQDQKERSESRISLLMGRKRGKVCTISLLMYGMILTLFCGPRPSRPQIPKKALLLLCHPCRCPLYLPPLLRGSQI